MLKLYEISKPVPITIAAIVVIQIANWFSLSGMDYQPGRFFLGLQTGGWYLMGLPFSLLFSILVAWLFAMIARRFRPSIAWGMLVVLAMVDLWYAYSFALPESRVARSLKMPLTDRATILQLTEYDSLNDGVFTRGAFRGSPELLAKIIKSNKLEAEMQMLQWWDDPEVAEFGLAFHNEHLTCYSPDDGMTIYFYHHSR